MEEITTEVSSSIGGFNMGQISTEVTDCNSYIIDSSTLLATPSSPSKIEAKNKGLFGKIPVTIAQPKIQIYVEAALKLPHPALAVTSVSKNVFLTRSQLMPTDDKKSAKLLLNGFVRKTIQFAVPNDKSHQGISGDIRFSTFDIPFKCFAKVDYLVEPDFSFDESPRAINVADSCYFGADTSQYTFVNSQFLNERVSVELLSATIRDVGKKNDCSDFRYGNNNSPVFRVIDESMVVELVLRVTQNQLVEVPASESKNSECHGSKNSGNSCNSGDNSKDDNKDNCKGNQNSKGGNNSKGDKNDNHGYNGKGDKNDNYGHNGKGDKNDNYGHNGKSDKNDNYGHNGKGDKNDNYGHNCKDDKDDNHGHNCKDDKDDNHGHNCKDDKDDNHGHNCKDDKDDNYGHNCKDDKDDNHGHSCKGYKYNRSNEDQNDDIYERDDEYKEIGELKLSVPTRLMDQIKKYMTKS